MKAHALELSTQTAKVAVNTIKKHLSVENAHSGVNVESSHGELLVRSFTD
jgi:hypothetical protein